MAAVGAVEAVSTSVFLQSVYSKIDYIKVHKDKI